MSLSSSTAYLLVSHGSRDTRHKSSLLRLAQLVRQQLIDRLESGSQRLPQVASSDSLPQQQSALLLKPDFNALPQMGRYTPGLQPTTEPIWDMSQISPIVGTACLEGSPLPLHQQIYEFAVRAKGSGVNRVKVIPLFLLRGVHVQEDIPEEVELARQAVGPRITIDLCRHLGSHSRLPQVLKAKLSRNPAEALLLLAHGSRRPGSNRSIETLAKTLGGTAAYWSIQPNLETQVINLIQSGHSRLTVLPYFLFTGGITDAITRVTEEMAERFPRMSFRLLPPLGATPALANLILDLATDTRPQTSSSTVLPIQRVALRHFG